MMYDTIKNFPKQFEYQPDIQNKKKLKNYKKFIVLGMGGSNLAPDLLKIRDPYLNIYSHRNYGFPQISPDVLKKSLLIASSYSGNTEETIDGFKEAQKRGFPIAVITTGGKLFELAKIRQIPYVKLPSIGIQPRSAFGYATLGLAALMKLNHFIKELKDLALVLNSAELEKDGEVFAQKISGRLPVIYSSSENAAIAYNWKIKINETGKIPAFANSFPELNHNEMTGFDVVDSTRNLSKHFHFIFLKDNKDRSKIRKRMEITANLFRSRGLPVETIILNGKSVFHKIFSSLLLADWIAYHVAKIYGVEPEQVSMVEEFKKLIK